MYEGGIGEQCPPFFRLCWIPTRVGTRAYIMHGQEVDTVSSLLTTRDLGLHVFSGTCGHLLDTTAFRCHDMAIFQMRGARRMHDHSHVLMLD